MKRILSVTLILTLLLSCLSALPSGAVQKGNGTENNPYIIESEADFLRIKNNPSAHYLLNGDIVLSDGYTPFAFSGTLIGNDTKNLPVITVNITKAESGTGDPAGLFTVLSGNVRIENICLSGNITGKDFVGGFAGKDSASAGSVIENCINEAVIHGNNTVGGIIASVSAAISVNNCVNVGNIYGNSYVGGIAGASSTNTIYLCRNLGNITATGSAVGGIVGRGYGYINYCSNSGNIKGGSYVGGIIGMVNGKRTATYLYNIGTIEATLSSENNDCGGLIGGLASGEQRYITITRGYNGGDVISPGGNYNPIYPSFVSSETVYVKAIDIIYLSDSKKDDGKEGTEAVSKDDFPTIDAFFGEYNSILNKAQSDNNSSWMSELLSQLGCRLAMYKGNRIAVADIDGITQMLRVDENDTRVVPEIRNGTTVVPVSFVSRVFGADVEWIPEKRSVEIKFPDKTIVIVIGEKTAYVNGKELALKEPAFIENGRTFVPLRAIAEMLGKYVYWNDCGIILIGDDKIELSDEFVNLARSIWIIPAGDLNMKLKDAKPGDEIIVANGKYTDVTVNVDINATAEKPVIIRAETPGGVEFTGTSHFAVSGSYITIRDFYFNKCISDYATVNFVNVYNSRLTGCYFYNCGHTSNGQFEVVGASGNTKFNRFDHNAFERPRGMCYKISINGMAPRERNTTDMRIDHNYFVDVPTPRTDMPNSPTNAMEVVNLIGGADLDYGVNHTVEYNRFEDIVADGGEGICLKSCGNKINYNTFINSRMSGLSMRANENTEVIGNFFFKTKYGLRIFGSGHTFKNNYLYDSYRSGFVAHGGSHTGGYPTEGPNQVASDFYAENNLTIYPNHAGIMLGDNFNADNGYTNGPSNLIFKNNLFYLKKGTLVKDYRSSNVKYEGNKYHLEGSAVSGEVPEGFEKTDVPLVFDGEIWLPENMLDFDKQGLISVSECGPEDRWWESLLRYTPKYFFDIEPEGKPDKLEPVISYAKITTKDILDLRGIKLNAIYPDEYLYNPSVEIQHENISYTCSSSDVKINVYELTSDKAGEYILKLGYKGLETQIRLSVIDEYSGDAVLEDNFDAIETNSYFTHSGSLWKRKDGVIKSKDTSIMLNASKTLEGDYEAKFDMTLTDDSGSGAISGGFIFGYANTPDLSYYLMRFGDETATNTGFYEVDSHVSLKSSKLLVNFEPNKKYSVTFRVIGDTAIVLVDNQIASVLENLKNKSGKFGFLSGGDNSVIVDNFKITHLEQIEECTDIKELNIEAKRIDSTMCLVNFSPLKEKNLCYRTYRNGFQLYDSIDKDEGYTEVSLRVGENIEYSVKAFDEYGRIVGKSVCNAYYKTDGTEEFFTISDVYTKQGPEDAPYVKQIKGVRSRGLKAGLPTHWDRNYTINELPSMFNDCGFIRMGYRDHSENQSFRKAEGDYLKFNINRSATVYIITAKSNYIIPEWLSDGWESVEISEGNYTANQIVWAKHFDVPENSSVTVNAGGFSNLPSSYLLFVKPDIMPEFAELKNIPLGMF